MKGTGRAVRTAGFPGSPGGCLGLADVVGEEAAGIGSGGRGRMGKVRNLVVSGGRRDVCIKAISL